MMKYRLLGRSGLRVSQLFLGAMIFGDDRGWGADRDESRRMIAALQARYAGETVVKLWRYWGVYRRFKAMLAEALAAPDRWTYSDLAIAPPQADEFEALDLYHATSGGEAALARKRRDEAIRAGTQPTARRAPAISAAE